MAETFGANRGITPTISKGVKRQNIRYNIDDKVTNYSINHKRTKDKFEDLNRAKVGDLLYYLGDDWIDWENVKFGVNKTSRTGNITTMSKVLRCISCFMPYQTKTSSSRGNTEGNKILPQSIFHNVPLEKGECGFCG